jgi:anaerobic selenocysteine-containing dehydrogenase
VLINPGSDTALALAMEHVIVAEGLTDSDFISEHTLGFEALAQHLNTFSPERAEPITGISAYDGGKALPALAKVNEAPELWIHPLDAQQRGVAPGNHILIYNERGRFSARARITEDVPPGVVWMRDGWVGLNRVTNGNLTLPLAALSIIDPSAIPGGQAAFDARVEVRLATLVQR